MRSLRASDQRGRVRLMSCEFGAFQRTGLLLRASETLQRLPGNAMATGRARFVPVGSCNKYQAVQLRHVCRYYLTKLLQ